MFTSVNFLRLRRLKGFALKSVVTVLRYAPDRKKVIDFGAGFVLHVDTDSKRVVVVTSVDVIADRSSAETIMVRFGNGKESEASVLADEPNSILFGLIASDVDGFCTAAQFDKTRHIERGQLVATCATVWPEFPDIGMYTGSILSPSCISIKRASRRQVDDFKNYCAFSCPVAGPLASLGQGASFHRLVGAPVFNLEGYVVGVTERCSQKNYALKYARICSSAFEELNILFGTDDWEKQVQELVRNQPEDS